MPDYSRLLIRFLRTTLATIDRSRQDGEESSSSPASPEKPSSPDVRRAMAGMVAASMLAVAAIASVTPWLANWTGSESTSDFLISALTRIGLVIGAIWLAWDSMRRPARWIPPGLAVAGVVGIVIIAAQPKLIFAIIPLLGGLAVLTSIVRAVRRR